MFRQGNYSGARESFQMALNLKPEDANLLYNLGQCYDLQGDQAVAEKYYRQCLEKSANHPECRHALEVLLYRSGRKAEAGRMIQDWLAAQPKLAAPYAEDAWRLRQEQAFPQAMTRCQQALTYDPHNLGALTELAILYEQAQNPERALVLYDRVLAIDPNQPDIVDRVNKLRRDKTGPPLPD